MKTLHVFLILAALQLTACGAFAAPAGGLVQAKTTGATNLTPTYGVLNGMVFAGSQSVTVFFEYGATEQLGEKTKEQQISVGTGWVPFSAGASLDPETKYYYRAVAEGPLGVVRGDVLALGVIGPPILLLEPLSRFAVAGESVMFRAAYDPDGSGPKSARDVTAQATWIAQDLVVAAHEGRGRFVGRAAGRTQISAFYHPSRAVVNLYDIENIRGDAEIVITPPIENEPPSAQVDESFFNDRELLGRILLLGTLVVLVAGAAGAAVWYMLKRE
jgi:hypothetical protein